MDVFSASWDSPLCRSWEIERLQAEHHMRNTEPTLPPTKVHCWQVLQ